MIKNMTRQECEKIISDFENGDFEGYMTRKQVMDVMVAMNVYTMLEITEELSRVILDHVTSNTKKI